MQPEELGCKTSSMYMPNMQLNDYHYLPTGRIIRYAISVYTTGQGEMSEHRLKEKKLGQMCVYYYINIRQIITLLCPCPNRGC